MNLAHPGPGILGWIWVGTQVLALVFSAWAVAGIIGAVLHGILYNRGKLLW